MLRFGSEAAAALQKADVQFLCMDACSSSAFFFFSYEIDTEVLDSVQLKLIKLYEKTFSHNKTVFV